MPVWLSEEQVRERLPMRELIDLMAATLAGFSSGKVEQPVGLRTAAAGLTGTT